MTESVPITAGLFVIGGDGSGALLGGHCAACRRWHFPRLSTCPYCAADGCDTRPLSQEGSLYLYTAVLNRPPGYKGDVPFGFGIVELPEALRIITRLTESDPTRLHHGMPMRLVFERLHTDEQGRDVVTYAFAPLAGSARAVPGGPS